jgi:hypothetical protein
MVTCWGNRNSGAENETGQLVNRLSRQREVGPKPELYASPTIDGPRIKGWTVHWGAYEVFSVLSGLAMVVLAVVPGIKAKDRMWALIAGALYIGYGIYVANQTSGTFVFPVWIFIIPFGVVIYLVVTLAKRYGANEGD